jgi:thiamine pyrophosphokinase
LPGSRELDLPAGSLFSVVAFTALEGLSLSGAKYPLDEADIAFGASRTISNVAEGRLTASLNPDGRWSLPVPTTFPEPEHGASHSET